MSRLVADGERFDRLGQLPDRERASVGEDVEAASWVKPRRRSPSWLANLMTSSRHRARPMATRSLIWRTFWIRVPAARTGAERSALEAARSPGAGRGG